MNFLRNKFFEQYKIFIIVLCLFFIPMISMAQIVLMPNKIQLAPVIINDYYYLYPQVPQATIISTQWYMSPNEIGKRIELNNVSHDIRYFKDDGTPYLEKTIDGIKGRLFLKEVRGYSYTILDLYFVSYKDRIKEISNQEISLNLDEIVESPSDNISVTIGTNDFNTEDNEKVEEVDEEKNSIPPLFSERETGISLIVDVVVLQESSEGFRRESLTRYNAQTKQSEYQETYVYTKKGAIQRLTRNFFNGGVQRYVYYFSTGGLKEIFYQDPDGSSYILNYTLAGALKRKRVYDTENKLSFDLQNTYSADEDLILQDEKNFLTSINIITKFIQNQISEKKIYRMGSVEKASNEEEVVKQEGVDVTEAVADQVIDNRELLKTEVFAYNSAGQETSKQEVDVLHEDIVAIEYNEKEEIENIIRDGVLISKKVKRGDESIDTYYFLGEEVLRIYYNKAKKLKEEIILNGEVIETREIE